MNARRKRGLFLSIAWGHLGRWYLWGGDDPSGFDCSGLVIECLQSVGLFPAESDTTAHGLWVRFADYRIDEPRAGALVFWKRPGHDQIVHIEICLDGEHAIGARGGGSSVKTIADAIKSNAYIKVRPLEGRDWTLELAGYAYLFDEAA